MSEIIKIQNLSIGYPEASENPIFPVFSITASESEMIALIGRNGVGKSTFLRTIIGLQKAISGELLINGRLIKDYSLRELASLISFVSTDNIRIQNLKVFNLVALGRSPHTDWLGNLNRLDKMKIIEAIEMVGLKHLINRNIAQLSDGELQRAMIARTLAQDTPIIILDEPTAFLDLPNKYEILILLKRLTRQKNKTIIFSTHDLNIAMRLVDKIWLMVNTGLQQGAPEDLALQKAYNKLFDNTLLSFDYEKSTVDLGIIPKSDIYLEAEDFLLFWLKKALTRMGFQVSNIKKPNSPKIKATLFENKLRLELIKDNYHKIFNDIYHLGRQLQNFF